MGSTAGMPMMRSLWRFCAYLRAPTALTDSLRRWNASVVLSKRRTDEISARRVRVARAQEVPGRVSSRVDPERLAGVAAVVVRAEEPQAFILAAAQHHD